MNNKSLARALLRAIGQQKKTTRAIDTQAVVKRVEGDTIWVHIPGGVDETPIRKTISAKAGDTVQIRVAGGRAWATGNETSPPTDDTTANAAGRRARAAIQQAKDAQEEAEKASRTARAKAKTFQTFDDVRPAPPYYIGDMWVLTYMDDDSNRIRELYTCIQEKAEGEAFDQEDWQLSATDDATAAEALGIANSLQGWSEEIDAIIADLATQAEFDMVTNDLSERISDLDWYGYLNLYGRDGGTPVIELGSREKSSYVLITTPSNLGFYKNNGNNGGLETQATAYFGESATQGLFGLIAGVLEAQKYLTVGNFVFIANSDGSLTVKKVGE